MKTAIYLIIIGCLFYALAFGQSIASPQYTPPARQYNPAQTTPPQNQPQNTPSSAGSSTQTPGRLAGLPNPALVGLQALRVTAIYNNTRLRAQNYLWSATTARAERRLAESDTRLAFLIRRGYELRYLDVPSLTITVDKFLLGPARPPILFVQTSLEAGLTTQSNTNTIISTTVWSITETIQAQAAQAELAAVSSLIYQQIDRFAADFSQANSYFAPIPEPNDVNSLPSTPAVPTPTTPQPQQKPKNITVKDEPASSNFSFVSSTSSNVFHRSDCAYVKAIAPQNLITYNSREEAIASGKRPCKKCNP